MSQTWILPEQDRAAMIERIAKFLAVTLPGKRVEVSVKQFVKRRSLEQLSALWGHAYKIIHDETGNDPVDMHWYFCGEFWGWKQSERIFDQVRTVPRRTTTTDENGKRDVISTKEFSEFFAFIQQRMAEVAGLYIPDPVKEIA